MLTALEEAVVESAFRDPGASACAASGDTRATKVYDGPHSSVWLVELAGGRQVAVKQRRDLRTLGAEFARLQALQPSCEGIPTLLSSTPPSGSRPWFAMEPVRGASDDADGGGRTLQLLLQGNRVSLLQALQYLAGAAQGLRAMHSRGLFHGRFDMSKVLLHGSEGVLSGIECPFPARASSSFTCPEDVVRAGCAGLSESCEGVLGPVPSAPGDTWSLGVALAVLLSGPVGLRTVALSNQEAEGLARSIAQQEGGDPHQKTQALEQLRIRLGSQLRRQLLTRGLCVEANVALSLLGFGIADACLDADPAARPSMEVVCDMLHWAVSLFGAAASPSAVDHSLTGVDAPEPSGGGDMGVLVRLAVSFAKAHRRRLVCSLVDGLSLAVALGPAFQGRVHYVALPPFMLDVVDDVEYMLRVLLLFALQPLRASRCLHEFRVVVVDSAQWHPVPPATVLAVCDSVFDAMDKTMVVVVHDPRTTPLCTPDAWDASCSTVRDIASGGSPVVNGASYLVLRACGQRLCSDPVALSTARDVRNAAKLVTRYAQAMYRAEVSGDAEGVFQALQAFDDARAAFGKDRRDPLDTVLASMALADTAPAVVVDQLEACILPFAEEVSWLFCARVLPMQAKHATEGLFLTCVRSAQGRRSAGARLTTAAACLLLAVQHSMLTVNMCADAVAIATLGQAQAPDALTFRRLEMVKEATLLLQKLPSKCQATPLATVWPTECLDAQCLCVVQWASFRQSIEYYDRGGELWKVSVDKLADVVCGALKFDVAAPEASLAARPHGILSCMANVFLATALLMSGRASSSCRAAILNATTACSKRLLYSHHPSNATIASYVAVDAMWRGRYDEAVTFFRQSLDIHLAGLQDPLQACPGWEKFLWSNDRKEILESIVGIIRRHRKAVRSFDAYVHMSYVLLDALRDLVQGLKAMNCEGLHDDEVDAALEAQAVAEYEIGQDSKALALMVEVLRGWPPAQEHKITKRRLRMVQVRGKRFLIELGKTRCRSGVSGGRKGYDNPVQVFASKVDAEISTAAGERMTRLEELGL